MLATELDAALHPRPARPPALPARPLEARAALGQRHEAGGDEWFGFESVRILPGLDAEIALVPLLGHSLGHTGVALSTGDGWLLHCGDAYFNHGEVQTPPSCPPGLRLLPEPQRRRQQGPQGQPGAAARAGRRATATRSTLFCSHDPHELEREQAGGRRAPRAA